MFFFSYICKEILGAGQFFQLYSHSESFVEGSLSSRITWLFRSCVKIWPEFMLSYSKRQWRNGGGLGRGIFCYSHTCRTSIYPASLNEQRTGPKELRHFGVLVASEVSTLNGHETL